MQKTTILAIAIICIAAIVIINFFNVPGELPSTQPATIEENLDVVNTESENTNIFNLEDVGTRHQDVLAIIEDIENKRDNGDTENTREVMQKPTNAILKDAVQTNAPVEEENNTTEKSNTNEPENTEPSEDTLDTEVEIMQKNRLDSSSEAIDTIIQEVENANDALDTNE